MKTVRKKSVRDTPEQFKSKANRHQSSCKSNSQIKIKFVPKAEGTRKQRGSNEKRNRGIQYTLKPRPVPKHYITGYAVEEGTERKSAQNSAFSIMRGSLRDGTANGGIPCMPPKPAPKQMGRQERGKRYRRRSKCQEISRCNYAPSRSFCRHGGTLLPGPSQLQSPFQKNCQK